MKKILFILSLFISAASFSQTTGFFRYDTIAFQKSGGNAEFNLYNGTRNVTGGVLTNMGGGRTRFVLPTGSTLTSLGSGFKVGIDGTSNTRTVDGAQNIFPDSSTTANVVTFNLGATSQALAASRPFTVDRWMNMGTFPGRRALTMFSDVSSVIPSYPTDMTVFQYPGRLDFKTADGGAINFYVLDSAVTFGSSFPAVHYRSGYNGTLQAFNGLHWDVSDKHYDIVDLRGSLTSAQIQIGGTGAMILATSGVNYFGINIGVKRTRFGSNAVPGQTVSIGGSLSVTDSSMLQGVTTIFTTLGDTNDSVRVKDNVTGVEKSVAQSSIVGATPTLQQVFGVESNIAVMTADDNTIQITPGGSSGVFKIFKMGNLGTDDVSMYVTNNGTGRGDFSIYALDSITNSQYEIYSDGASNRIKLSAYRSGTSRNHFQYIYPDSIIFNRSGATTTDLDLRFKNLLSSIDTTTNKPLGIDSTNGKIIRMNSWAQVAPVTNTSTNTFTNKRWTARVGSTTSSATPTINTDATDIYKLTAQAADITSMTTNLSGTPVDGDILEIQITGTAARAITWGASFVSSTVTLPTTTVTTATLTVILQYYTTSSYGNNKWICVNSY